MQAVDSLIDKASEMCGSDSALAKRLEVSRAIISMMRSGKRPIPPELAAIMADIAGEDATEAMKTAMLANTAGTRRGQMLRAVLGKGLAAGVAAMLVFSYSGDSISATEKIAANEQLIHRIY